MKPWMLSELKDVLGCDVPVEAEITCVSTDTRDLPQGCLFVALRGERFDAHDFVKQAIEAGAVAAVTEKPIEGCPCLVVKHTGRALLQIARFYREKFHPTLVGITGSVGKTTTKEMIACVLESQYATLKTQVSPRPCSGWRTATRQLSLKWECPTSARSAAFPGRQSRASA